MYKELSLSLLFSFFSEKSYLHFWVLKFCSGTVYWTLETQCRRVDDLLQKYATKMFILHSLLVLAGGLRRTRARLS